MYQIQFRKILENVNGKYLNALTVKQHCATTAYHKQININEKTSKIKKESIAI